MPFMPPRVLICISLRLVMRPAFECAHLAGVVGRLLRGAPKAVTILDVSRHRRCGTAVFEPCAEGELIDVPVVLVVEDDELLQEIVHDALKEGGFDLTTVTSGDEAVAMIESGVVKYSALVTDISYPNGLLYSSVCFLAILRNVELRPSPTANVLAKLQAPLT